MTFLSSIVNTILLGIIQGITEWLPISSTGHLILFASIWPLEPATFFEVFKVVIQFGSILAVLVLYYQKLNPFDTRKSPKKRKQTLQLWSKVIVGVIPAAIIGLLLDDIIEGYLSANFVIAVALIAYGIIFILVEKNPRQEKIETIEQVDYVSALKIGCFQCLALIPGTSRSGATIVGALIIGVSREVAAEFTFFLAIPVMFGASALKLIKFGFHFTAAEFGFLMLGCVVSFGMSVIAIKFLMNYIKKNDFKVFGYYRIILGALIILVALFKMLLG